MGVYLAAAGGDRQLALELDEWNGLVSAAFQHDLAHLEVALRNAYDAALVANTRSGLPHWTTDPYRLFPVRWRAARDGTRIHANRFSREQIEGAVDVAGPGAPPGKVIAELTFESGATCQSPLITIRYGPIPTQRICGWHQQICSRSADYTSCVTASHPTSPCYVATAPPGCSA